VELLTGTVLFPGKNYLHQLDLIFKVRGMPDSTFCDKITNKQAKEWVMNQKKHDKVDLREAWPELPAELVDLFDKMLELDPQKRITAKNALQHPFFEELHDPEDERDFEGKFDFSFETDKSLTLKDY
jgi:serine/threonine protein kinase